MDWNPRYVEYAKAHGRTPDEMLAHDSEMWSGGKMTGFIIWMGEQWDAFDLMHGYNRRTDEKAGTDERHAEFDAWLQSKVS